MFEGGWWEIWSYPLHLPPLSYLLSGKGSLPFQGKDVKVPCDTPEPNIGPYTLVASTSV